jgi:gliding motility-associated-like protein/uncharacterized repeat protein (TIGR01451 family)
VLFSFRAAAQFAMPDYVCIGATKHYNVDPNPVSGSTYTWKIDGVIQSRSTKNVIDITWKTAGTYLLDVQELSISGCPGPLRSGQVFVHPSTGPTIITGGAFFVCQDAQDETYIAIAENCTSIIYSVIPLTAGVINETSGVMNWDGAFSGIATITAISSGLCTSTSAERVVSVDPIPLAVAGSNSPVCEGNTTILTAQTVPGGTYNWTGPDGFTSSDQNPEILTTSIADAGTYTLFVSTNACVSDPSSVNLVVNNCANADLGIVKTADNYIPLIGQNVVFTIVASNNSSFDATGVEVTELLNSGYNYVSSTATYGTYDASYGLWTIGTMLKGVSETLTITSSVNSSGTYVNIANISGLEPEANMENNVSAIEPEPKDFFIPEGYSPNNDGINDFFVIRGILFYPDNTIVIFNRWGNKVFETSPYQNTWDGKTRMGTTIGEDELPVGTYFYVLDLGNGSTVIKGTIYLNR